MAETTTKAAETPKTKKGFSVQRVEGLKGLQDLLNGTEGKVQSWQRVGEGATFIVIMEGVTLPAEPEPVPEPEPDVTPVTPVAAEEKDEGNGRKKKSAA